VHVRRGTRKHCAATEWRSAPQCRLHAHGKAGTGRVGQQAAQGTDRRYGSEQLRCDI
jgi:hypothetical protein